ncbi:MAG: histidinol-phosphatase HisJ family protein [Clostridia bacterium]|nr:histidinol-phosphatase HisJ family protein [Clostridia bacterium]
MEYKQNLHTHSTYCDGKNSLEELILHAIEKGFSSIGFSSHSYMSFCDGVGLTKENEPLYKKEIEFLKEKYKNKIEIFKGIEYETFSNVDTTGYDYVIGSSHFLKIDGKYVDFDLKLEPTKKLINDYFDGDYLKFSKAYYENLSNLYKTGKIDIIGHFDIISKHSDNILGFDEFNKTYLSYALDTLNLLKGKIPFFELNTGAIARGYKKTPYPNVVLLKEMQKMGYSAIITSDCHKKEFLDFNFKESEQLLKECGFKEKFILTKNGFKGIKLQ